MTDFAPTRRGFLAAATATLSVPLLPAGAQTMPGAHSPEQALWPGAYLRIDTDGAVTCVLPTCEMGQGTHTGQAQILADELGADWTTIRVDMPAQPGPDYRLPFGQMRSVGSYGIRHWHDPMREAAARMRMMLIQAAADELGVNKKALDARDGRVVHDESGRAISFADLVPAAALLPVPAVPKLRPEAAWRLNGQPVHRLDTPAKVRGETVYGIDVVRPDMAYGAVRLSPVFGGQVASIDSESIRSMPGVIEVVQVPGGAVVVGETWWQAKRAADALDIAFEGGAEASSTGAMAAEIEAALDRADVPVTLERGDLGAFEGAAHVVEADYGVPMLAHVCMEPLNCTAQATEERTELWTGTQGHDGIRMALERDLGIPSDQLFFNTQPLGGGFGRRTFEHEAVQAILASRALGGRPVKVIWAREDDVQQGLYRQIMRCRLRGAVDAEGRLIALRARMAGPQMGAFLVQANNMDPFSLTGLVDLPYRVPNYVLDHAVVDIPVPLAAWRAIASTFTGYFVEAFMDEMAAAAGIDPVAFRLLNLPEDSQARPVLERAAAMAGWDTAPPEGVHRGVAVVGSYGSWVAQVVEVNMEGERVTVPRVHVAIDCGRAINPGQVETQMQGSVVDGLGAALRCKITVAGGRTEQANFPDYPLLRIEEAPEISVEIVETGAPLGGVGEPGLPPAAPALCNAVFAATGRRIRSLPLSDHGLA